MPYKIEKDGSKWCVRNPETGESKGCSESKEMATRHMRALYANEDKSLEEFEDALVKSCDALEMTEDEARVKSLEMWEARELASYSMVTSYGEFDQMVDAIEQASEVKKAIAMFPEFANNIMMRPDIEDKSGAIAVLAGELASRIDALTSGVDENEMKQRTDWGGVIAETVAKVKALFTKSKPAESNVMIWKEANGEHRWIARYSNMFRDRDNPAQIISSASHRRFADLVDKGLAPMPELWLWHVKEWRIGQADWVAYDEAGFSLAGGHFFPESEPVAEWLSTKEGDFGCSHGMPVSTLKFDLIDPTVIVEHETREISFLPAASAANEMTSFVTIKELEDVMIPKNKKDALEKRWGLSPDLLEKIEAINANDAEKAISEGVQFKEVTEEEAVEATPETSEESPVQEAPAEEPITEPTPPVEEKASEPSQEFPTRQEVADAVSTVVLPLMDAMKEISDRLSAFESQLGAVAKETEQTRKEIIGSSSPASLTSMLLGSLTKSDEAIVKEDDPLAKAGPKTPEGGPQTTFTGVPFIDSFLRSN